MRKIILLLALLLLSTVIMSGSDAEIEKTSAVTTIQKLNNSLDKFHEIRSNNSRNDVSNIMRDIQKNEQETR